MRAPALRKRLDIRVDETIRNLRTLLHAVAPVDVDSAKISRERRAELGPTRPPDIDEDGLFDGPRSPRDGPPLYDRWYAFGDNAVGHGPIRRPASVLLLDLPSINRWRL